MAALKKQARKENGRSRGRQSTFDRDEALEIALNLFWRHGYEGVSIAALTQSIGIAAPSLYHAFGSKEGLYREVIRRYQGMGLSASQIAECASSFEATRKILEFGIVAVTRSTRPAGCMVSSGLLMASPEHADLARQMQKERAKLRVFLQKWIEKDIHAGLVDASVNAAGLARFYTTVLQGLSVQAIDGATHSDLQDVMEIALLSWPRLREPKTKRIDAKEKLLGHKAVSRAKPTDRRADSTV
jgi:TetR/AcrR family transcriptional regulator, copper-responsive repressor